MKLNGTIMGRLEVCRECEFKIEQHSRFAPEPGGTSRFCLYPDLSPSQRDQWRVVDREFLGGPESNCAAGKWADAEAAGPVDPDEWLVWSQEERRKKNEQSFRENFKPVVVERLSALKEAGRPKAAWDSLVTLTRITGLRPEHAQEIAEAVGIKETDEDIAGTPTSG